MTEKLYYEDPNPVNRIRMWALSQMLWGAFLAAVFLVAVGSVLFAIYLAGLLLPEESKQAPSPYGALAAETTTLAA
jgi:hypothetical protein